MLTQWSCLPSAIHSYFDTMSVLEICKGWWERRNFTYQLSHIRGMPLGICWDVYVKLEQLLDSKRLGILLVQPLSLAPVSCRSFVHIRVASRVSVTIFGSEILIKSISFATRLTIDGNRSVDGMTDVVIYWSTDGTGCRSPVTTPFLFNFFSW